MHASRPVYVTTVSLPTAGAGDAVLRSNGAGAVYVAEVGSDFLERMLGVLLASESAGAALVADGTGGVKVPNAAITAFLNATSAEEARDSLLAPLHPVVLTLAAYGANTGAVAASGLISFDPADYAIDGKTLAIHFITIANVSAGGLEGSIGLYDLTASASAAANAYTETVTTLKSAVVAVPNSARVYELQSELTVGVGAIRFGAYLRLSWS